MRTTTTALLLTALATTPGCALFQSACAKAMPVLQIGQAYGSEAAAAVDQAAAYASTLALSPELKLKVGAALEGARKALRVGELALAEAANACSQLDPVKAFAEFIAAWQAVRDALGTTAGLHGAPAGVGGLQFDDPAIYRIARGAR